MASAIAVLAREHVASIRDVQKNPSRALTGITRVVRGSKTIGFFLSNEEWDGVLEDFKAMGSVAFRARITSARKQAKSGKATSFSEVAAQYGLSV
jgi:hypothetical protein